MINVYDFDNTIYDGDSTLDFYFFCLKKKPQIIFLIFIQIYGFIMYKLHIKNKEFFKEKFFAFLNKFKNIDKLVKEFWKVKEKNIKKWYLDQKKDNDVIISASPEFLLKPICDKLKVNLIASDVDKRTGIFESNNCYGEEKVKRFKKKYALNKINSFYGDSKSDECIAKHAKKAYLVKGTYVSEWDLDYKKEIKKFIFLYVVLFAMIFCSCIGLFFWTYGKSFFWNYDGLAQHYLIFSYIGDLIRDLFTGKGFVMWNNGIGYGADVLTSLAAYLYDPFNWISALFKHEYTEFGFNLMVFLKMFASGLSFGLYGIYKKYDYKKILTGSILYAFSATAFIVFIQSFFINPMYIFPILIIGCDKLLKENNPLVYVFSLSFAFINYFYFAYMMCIFILFYCLIHFIFDEEIEKGIKNFAYMCIKFTIYTFFAVGVSATILLPVAKLLLSMNRLGINYYLPLFYDKEYYVGITKGLINYYYMSGRDCLVGFGAICLPCIICLFQTRDKKLLKYKVELLLLTIVLIVPYLSTILNGFSYYANRWIWCLAFLVCDIVCIMREHIKEMKSHLITEIIIVVYALTIIVGFKYNNLHFIFTSSLSLLIIFVLNITKNKKIFNNLYLIFAIISVCSTSILYFGSSFADSTKDSMIRGIASEYIYNAPGQEMLYELNETDPYRYQVKNTSKSVNSSWIYKRSGFDHYISMYNNDINIFNDEIGLVTDPSSMRYTNNNDKSEISYLFGVKYYINVSNYKTYNPYGYDKTIKSKDYETLNYKMYVPGRDVSLVYGFNNVINRKDYGKLDAYNKEKVLMEGIVLENEKTNFEYKNEDEVNYKMVLGYGIDNNGKEYIFKDKNYIDLNFDEVKNCELNLYVNGISFKHLNETDATVILEFYNNNARVKRMSTYIHNNKIHMFGNKKNYVFNTGYYQTPFNRIRIILNEGTYNINEIKVYKRNKEELDNSIKNLNNIVEDIKYYNNKFDIDLDVDKDEYAFISVPYSNGGWKAYLDDEEVEILKTDTAFMSIKVKKGKHKLILKYRTPGFYEGLTITILSVIILLIVMKKRRFFYEKI